MHLITQLYYTRYAERAHASTVLRHILGGVDPRQAPILVLKTNIKLNRTVAEDRGNRHLPANKLCVLLRFSMAIIFYLAFPSFRGRKSSHRRGRKGKKDKKGNEMNA